MLSVAQDTSNINLMGMLEPEEVSEFAIISAVVNHEIRKLASFE